ncbi:MAG: leucine-rich repeat domain-containing protein [Bacteroidales bacterium]|nr:leucine-rich repeat domain-containing protein [Bacteroidales bacterium]
MERKEIKYTDFEVTRGRATIMGSPSEVDTDFFRERTDIVEAVIPEGVKSLGPNLFRGCSNLRLVSFPSTLESIGDHAFMETGLGGELRLPEGLISLGNGAFSGCAFLEKVFIPKSLKYLDSGAFSYCVRLSGFEVERGNPHIDSKGECLLSDNGTILRAGCRFSEIPEGVKYIGEESFSGHVLLCPPLFPSSLLQISPFAFRNCLNLGVVKFPPSLRWVGTMAFAGSDIRELHMNEGLEEIGEMAFSDCRRLGCVKFSASMVPVMKDAFERCPSLVRAEFPQNAEWIPSGIFEKGKTATLMIRNPDPEAVFILGGNFDPSTISIEVPAGSYYAYKTHPLFGLFRSIKEY